MQILDDSFNPIELPPRAKEVQQAAAEVPGPVGPQPVPSSRRKSERSKGTGDMDDMTSQKFYATFHGSIDDGYRLDDLRGEAAFDNQGRLFSSVVNVIAFTCCTFCLAIVFMTLTG